MIRLHHIPPLFQSLGDGDEHSISSQIAINLDYIPHGLTDPAGDIDRASEHAYPHAPAHVSLHHYAARPLYRPALSPQPDEIDAQAGAQAAANIPGDIHPLPFTERLHDLPEASLPYLLIHIQP